MKSKSRFLLKEEIGDSRMKVIHWRAGVRILP